MLGIPPKRSIRLRTSGTHPPHHHPLLPPLLLLLLIIIICPFLPTHFSSLFPKLLVQLQILRFQSLEIIICSKFLFCYSIICNQQDQTTMADILQILPPQLINHILDSNPFTPSPPPLPWIHSQSQTCSLIFRSNETLYVITDLLSSLLPPPKPPSCRLTNLFPTKETDYLDGLQFRGLYEAPIAFFHLHLTQ